MARKMGNYRQTDRQTLSDVFSVDLTALEGDHKNKKIEYEKKLKKIAKNKPSVVDASTKAKKDLSVSS